MDNLYLALKILSVILLALISFRVAKKVLPFAFGIWKSGSSFLALFYILPVIVLITLSVYVIVLGFVS